jgi:hypothetical protein
MVDRADRTRIHEANFQRVRFHGAGAFVLIITWEPAGVAAYVNGQPLATYDPEAAPLTIRLHGVFTGTCQLSLLDPSATTACQKWMDNRRQKFSGAPVLRAGRKPKSLKQEAEDLITATDNVISLANTIISNGQKQLIGYLAADLRALVYWTRDDRREAGYNPLLLRMASKADLPLPVFALSDPLGLIPGVGGDAKFLVAPVIAGLVHYSASLTLMDLQEWLNTDFAVFRHDPGEPQQSERRVSFKEIISETANALGAAHYDEDISETVDTMKEFLVDNTDSLARTLSEIAGLLSQLGKWTVNSLLARGLIDPAQMSRALHP